MATTYPATVAGNIRAELARAGRTKSDLENILGLSWSAVDARWSGRKEFTLSEVSRVALALGIPIAQLTTTQAVAA